jgi:ABC-2 type transport system permease protein
VTLRRATNDAIAGSARAPLTITTTTKTTPTITARRGRPLAEADKEHERHTHHRQARVPVVLRLAPGHVVICLSLLLLGVGVFMWPGRQFFQVDRATLSQMFEALPLGLVLLIVPVVTMRLVAEEKRSGTLEMLITLPVRDSDVILGKFLGAFGLVLVFIASTLLYPLVMFKVFHLGPIDMGPVWSGYLGLVLFGAATVALGLMVSSLTDSQVIAFFITFISLVMLYVVGEVYQLLPNVLGTICREISFREHYASFERGLIDTRDIIFFVSCAVLALMLAFRSLESRKWT